MLLALLGALALAPFYWLLTPARRRRDVLALASLAVLVAYDPHVAAVVGGVALGLFAALRVIRVPSTARDRVLVVGGLVALAALFVWNKRGARGGGVLPSQGVVLLGVSYLVLKATAALVDGAGGADRRPDLGEIVAWLAFLPTYPAGPIEGLEHFAPQRPGFDRTRALGGLERILLGLVRALLVAHYLGVWSDPILAEPAAHPRALRLLALYAFTLRFYFDFAGYSDIAIGLAALFGYDIEENFDNPLVRRNLVQLWQRWHMTLTGWLRRYLFIPASRTLLRRGWSDGLAIGTAQLVTMTFCGLWHEIDWGFALWGASQALGLFWVGIVARDLGRWLPRALVAWWRRSPVAYALSTALTFNAFALPLVFVASSVGGGFRYLALLVRR